MIRLAAALALAAAQAQAQVVLEAPDPPRPAAVRAGTGTGAVLRTLDRTSGEVIDVEMEAGQTMAYGPLQVTLAECRYPEENPAGDAFARVRIVEARVVEELFAGWMVASSPALSALEHRRYDVWVLRCLGTGA